MHSIFFRFLLHKNPKSTYYRPSIKLYWRFWADVVSKQDRPTRFSWQAAHSARYVKIFHNSQEHYHHRTWWSFFSVAPFSTMIPISQCSDTRKKQKLLATKTWKMILRCRFQKVFWSFNLIDIFRINIYYCIV